MRAIQNYEAVKIKVLVPLVGAALILLGCQATRAGYESAPCQVVRSDGKFGLREPTEARC